ncbi:MAG TPA: signal peptidase I [Clostridiaceae bacterium]|nr:signal peptidase I [Clostridiaceae bacterium]
MRRNNIMSVDNVVSVKNTMVEKSTKNALVKLMQKSKVRNTILILSVLAIFAMDNYLPSYITGKFTYIYIYKPLMWISVILIIFYFPRIKTSGKIRFQELLKWMTVLFSTINILAMILGGIIQGFGRSPYDHSFIGIVANFIFIFVPIAGREMLRSYIVNNGKRKNVNATLYLITILMTLTNLSIDIVNGLKTKLDIIKYIGEVFLPELSLNILSTYLVYIGGAMLPIIYIGIKEGITLLSPILPNLSWITNTLIGTFCPFFSMMFLQYIYNKEAKIIKSSDTEDENPFGWILTSIISVSIVWFCVGVFPIRPFVIATGSMEPVIYAGDMVLVKRIDIDELKEGDIIQYEKENIYIFHRIIDIVEEENEITYKTMGDNNSIPDPEPVKIGSVKGKVVYTIPKAGWPTLLLKSRNNGVDREKVEY